MLLDATVYFDDILVLPNQCLSCQPGYFCPAGTTYVKNYLSSTQTILPGPQDIFSQRALIAPSINFAQPIVYTLSFWFKFTAVSCTLHNILLRGASDSDRTPGIYFRANRLFPRHSSTNAVDDGPGYGATVYAANTWYHQVIAVNVNTMYIFTNGVLDVSYTLSGGASFTWGQQSTNFVAACSASCMSSTFSVRDVMWVSDFAVTSAVDASYLMSQMIVPPVQFSHVNQWFDTNVATYASPICNIAVSGSPSTNICVASEGSVMSFSVYCYGSSTGCLFGSKDCYQDSDCSKYSSSSTNKFTEGTTYASSRCYNSMYANTWWGYNGCGYFLALLNSNPSTSVSSWSNWGSSGSFAVLFGVTKATDSSFSNGLSSSGINYFSGSTSSTISFPLAITQFPLTVCVLARYLGTSAQVSRRILQSSSSTNWFVGHFNSLSGLAYLNGWITRSDYSNIGPITNWAWTCVSIPATGSLLAYVNGVQVDTGVLVTSVTPPLTALCINLASSFGSAESSNFGISQLLTWDTALDALSLQAITSSYIQLCSANQFASVSGCAGCNSILPGSSSVTGSSGCVPSSCASGYYLGPAGSLQCLPCNSGYAISGSFPLNGATWAVPSLYHCDDYYANSCFYPDYSGNAYGACDQISNIPHFYESTFVAGLGNGGCCCCDCNGNCYCGGGWCYWYTYTNLYAFSVTAVVVSWSGIGSGCGCGNVVTLNGAAYGPAGNPYGYPSTATFTGAPVGISVQIYFMSFNYWSTYNIQFFVNGPPTAYPTAAPITVSPTSIPSATPTSYPTVLSTLITVTTSSSY